MSNREDGFFLPENASKARLKEAEDARKNRSEIIKAHSQGQVSRRDLVKWGLITSGGLLAPIHGLNPFVSKGHAVERKRKQSRQHTAAGVPTGAPQPDVWCSGFLHADATL